jgi:hypothetical protein
MGTAQNRKVYARHGVGEAQFGVSLANLRALGKKIKTDHPLARELWASGNHDARVLATMVADPQALGARELDDWSRELDNYVITDAFAGMVSKSTHALTKMEKWSLAMNGALIAIGMRGPGLEKTAIAAAKRIGKVDVDHGETGCKTPDAAEYIRRAVARRKKKKAKA